jgi:uncharacterized membrane protein YbjE (DUF340 family)
MQNIFIALFLGIAIGVFIKLPKKLITVNNRFQHMMVFLLLFSMGISIGANKSLLGKIGNLGIKSLAFALITAIMSIILVYFSTEIYTKKFSRRKTND